VKTSIYFNYILHLLVHDWQRILLVIFCVAVGVVVIGAVKNPMYLNYTSRSLVRGGQRTLLAIFCVAVGVMAIVALQLVGLLINNAFTSDVRDANGGDIAVRSQNEPFTQSDLTFFDQLKKDGTIQNYTATINIQGYTGKTVSRESFMVRVVDPAVYPIVTPPTFTNPTNGNIADLLKHNQIVVTQPFIDQYKKKLGDTFDMHIGSETQPVRTIHAKIVGIVSESGVLTQSGSLLLLSLADYNAASPQVPTPPQASNAPQADQGSSTLPGQANPGEAGTTPNNATSQRGAVYDMINVTTDAQKLDTAAKKIQQQFPIANTQTTADALKQQQESIASVRNFLSIAGLLALLIGGVGIVNTMQVLLSRRKIEIAMLKTTGYRRFDLYLLFGLEAGLLGLVGGLVGAGAATGVSYLVRNLVEQAFQFHIPFVLDASAWFTIGSGVVIGLATALIFGLLPIVQAANIRPLNVIRELPEGRGARSFFLTIFLLIVLSVLFCILAIVVLNNNVLLGAISVYATFIFLGVLSLFFALVVVLISKLPVPERFSWLYIGLVVIVVVLCALLYLGLPAFGRLPGIPGLPAVGGLLLIFALLGFVVPLLPRTWKANAKMALRNIGRQRARTTTTMLALFVGIFTIGLILVLGQDLRDRINELIARDLNYNVYVITANDDTTVMHNKLGKLPGLSAHDEHPIVSTAPVSINGKPIGDLLTGDKARGGPGNLGRGGVLHFLGGVEGFDVGNHQIPATNNAKILKGGRNLQPSDVGTAGTPDNPDNVVISSLLSTLEPLHLKVGDTIVLRNTDRSMTRTVRVVGIYESNGFGNFLDPPIWGTKDTVNTLSPVGLNQALFSLKIDSGKLSKATDVIGQAVPNAFVFNLSALTDIINQFLTDILLVLTTIASLSLLAGIIIIANAVALAMLERRRELGILKSVGYTSRSILSEVLLENGVVSGTGALLAMLLVTLATSLLGTYLFKASFGVPTPIALVLIFGVVALAMFVSTLVAWGAVRVRPLEVLRYE
jgi:ABC-type antimicrobial peptide transport system permease subunit